MSDSQNQLSKHIDALLQRTSEVLTAESVENKPVIAVWGMMNAGKSYLLNMLCEHYDREYFTTNDIRETAQLKQFEGTSFVFLDTPGLDGCNLDDQQALAGAAKADLVLFVHQALGELEKIELDFLEQLCSSFGRYAEQNIVLVISKADTQSLESLDQVERNVLQQCQQFLGFKPVSFQVSGRRFHQGIQKDKQRMIDASHLPALQQHITKMHLNIEQVRIEKQRQSLEALLEEYTELESTLMDEKLQIENTLEHQFASFNYAVGSLQTSIKKQRADYQTIKQQGA